MSIPKVSYRAWGNYDPDVASHEAAVAATPNGPGESLTVQSMADDADINILMKRYGITGHFPENPRVPVYGDFEGISDYQSALEAVKRADEMFMEYPAELRARFNNNPQAFLDFCGNPANIEDMRKLGLMKDVAPVVTAPVPPVAPAVVPAVTPSVK